MDSRPACHIGSTRTIGEDKDEGHEEGSFVLATAAALAAISVPAQATVQDHEHYSDAFSDDFTACGFSVHLEGVASGEVLLRDRGSIRDTSLFETEATTRRAGSSSS